MTTSLPQITSLPWDSAFFGYRIGRLALTIDDTDALETTLAQARQEGYALLYVTAPQPLGPRYEDQKVDTKVTYAQALSMAGEADPAIRPFGPEDDREVLYDLAYQSGAYSRYRLDPRFGEEAFRRFYRTWMDNSLTGKLADQTFVHPSNGRITGFLTVQQHGSQATIGLLATDEGSRGRGIGTALLRHLMAWLYPRAVTELSVVTQGDNGPACRFYERNGFTLQETISVYHFWL